MQVRDRRLLARCLALQHGDRAPSRAARLRRVGLAALLRLVTMREIYGALAAWLALRGHPLDEWVRARIRGFPDDDVARLREQPDCGLLRTLRRRLHRFSASSLTMRWRAARATLAALPATTESPGRTAQAHTWWCLPVLLPAADAAVAGLREQGIDATRRGSALVALDHGPAGSLAIEQAVYLPVCGLTTAHRRRIAAMVAVDRAI